MAVGYRLKRHRLRRRSRVVRHLHAKHHPIISKFAAKHYLRSEYYSNTLRFLANELKHDRVLEGRIFVNLLQGAALRIEELQRQLNGRIEYTARLWDENYKFKEKNNEL